MELPAWQQGGHGVQGKEPRQHFRQYLDSSTGENLPRQSLGQEHAKELCNHPHSSL
jgi:hypothetical protein